jgi:outer membrane protein assembly factor BamB
MNKTLLAAALLIGGASLFAGDVLRFRGENSQGVFEGEGLLKTWPGEGPALKWTYAGLGEGWSSPIKVGKHLYITGSDMTEKKEMVVCLDLDGKKVWQTATGSRWERAYPGARCTPTYVPGEKDGEGRLLVTTGTGEMFCLNAADGKILWSKAVSSDYGTNFMNWGLAESPVVKDGLVFMTAGGDKALVVALKIADGSVAWTAKSNNDKLGYVTPAIVKDQLIVMTDAKVNGISIKDGTVMWEDDYRATSEITARNGNNANTPVVKGNRFFVTGGYNRGGVLYELNEDGKGVKVIWKNKDLDPHHDSAVLVDGKLYGSNMANNNGGKWMCVDWETGKTVYETPWSNLGKGSVVYADGMLYLYEEKRGTIGLAKPGDKLDVVSSFPVNFGSKEHWAHLMICDGVLYIRHGDVLAAFDIKAK